MKSSLLIIALSTLGQHGADAFTSPVARSMHPNVCQQNTKEYAADGYTSIQLYATRIDDQLIIRGDIETTPPSSFTQNENSQVVATTGIPTTISLEDINIDTDTAEDSYRRGLTTIGFITLLFASNSPAVHSAFSMTSITPPCLLINAAVSVVGLTGVVMCAPFLGKFVPDPSKKSDSTDLLTSQTNAEMVDADSSITSSSSPNNFITRIVGPSTIAGAELGLWKTLGTTANIYGLSQTSSDHGAFLIQLTTLLVPAAQGFMGVPIPTRIWTAIGLAMGGVFMFTQDPNQIDSASSQGDLLCALAAIFYATYDLRLFKWGKLVPTDELITTKMVTQSLLSFGLLSILGREEALDFFSKASSHDLQLVGLVSLWSGLAVNCLAPYLQVSGQQAVGPARAQILYASQPLWAAIMSFILLGEQFGTEGLIGGSAFLGAMFLAATAEMPDPNCAAEQCEV
mmetsp:Transcript_14576/g.31702  ORF Transcript_14576/g.31702 Transcript_14576/m.31702 type:complete len:456 (+) Transcript_14576:223-1590(+)